MSTGTRFVWIILAVVALLPAAAQCGTQATPEASPAGLAPISLSDGMQLKVVATTSLVADIVRQVGGDLIDLTLLLPVGADPHTFQPSPQDLASVADSQVVFANGLGLESFLDEMIKNAGGQAAVVYVSQGVKTRELRGAEAHALKQEGEKQVEEQDRQGVDPHTWTSPANVMIFVRNINQTLSALDPAHSAVYQANAEAYNAKLTELDEWVKTQIALIPPENRELVTDHTAFGYYADRYGLEQIGAVIPSFSTAAEPSASSLAELEDAINAYKVKAIFVGTSVNSSLSQRVAEDTGIKLLTLYTGSLGPAGSGVESYVDYIKYNTNTIVAGLK